MPKTGAQPQDMASLCQQRTRTESGCDPDQIGGNPIAPMMIGLTDIGIIGIAAGALGLLVGGFALFQRRRT